MPATNSSPLLPRRLSLLLGSLACLLTIACAGSVEPPQPVFVVGSGSFPQAMQGVRRVALHPNYRIARPLAGRSAEDLRADMDRAVADALNELGFTVVPPGTNEERSLAYAVGIEGELGDQELLDAFGISPGLDMGKEIPRGGIVLVVLHPRTQRVLWRGSGSGPAKDTRPETRPEAIRKAVRVVLSGRAARPGGLR